MNKFRSFVAGLLLVPVLALSAGPVQAAHDRSSLEPARSAAAAGYCWIYFGGRWILVPC